MGGQVLRNRCAVTLENDHGSKMNIVCQVQCRSDSPESIALWGFLGSKRHHRVEQSPPRVCVCTLFVPDPQRLPRRDEVWDQHAHPQRSPVAADIRDGVPGLPPPALPAHPSQLLRPRRVPGPQGRCSQLSILPLRRVPWGCWQRHCRGYIRRVWHHVFFPCWPHIRFVPSFTISARLSSLYPPYNILYERHKCCAWYIQARGWSWGDIDSKPGVFIN